MKLSIIIVNYNVKFFLEQVLLSVKKATQNISSEVFVVDNNSVDGSAELVKQKFPDVILIENKDNFGFSKANNQAIKKASGEYILLLNPDTVVEEDTFEKCIAFMDSHSDAGGLGVKMIDGKGNFLPESKRSFPSPKVAFYKAFGFASLFPKSKEFSKYHLGNLSENETHEVEVLAGAFMLLRKKVLDEIGLLDEDFFMYGEDIDLSYRIVKAGYKNYYFADTKIIHYKGESTKKSSVNYVGVFYNAMIIFARKHFAGSRGASFILLLKLAIYFRAAISVLSRIIKTISFPVVDAALIFGGMFFLKNFWQNNVRADIGLHLPDVFIYAIVPSWILIWIISVYFSGGYDRSSKISKIVRGIFIGTVIIAALYGFLNEEYRSSRALIVLGAAWTAVAMIAFRLIYNFFVNRSLSWGEREIKNVIIVGNENEAARVQNLLNVARVNSDLIGFVSTDSVREVRRDSSSLQYRDSDLGDISSLKEIVSIYKIDEIIFCSKTVSSKNIFGWMERLGNKLEYKIVPEGSNSIIGSNSKDTAGDFYSTDVVFNINSAASVRNKRIFDVLGSVLLLIFFPFKVWFVKNKGNFFLNIFHVLSGKKSWVGYHKPQSDLPKIKEGILSPIDELKQKNIDEATASRLDLLYAKDYFTQRDLQIMLKGFRNLGR